MSSHTRIWVHPFDGEPINVASVRAALAAFLDESGIHHDTLESLDAACASALPSSEPTLFFLNSYFLVALFEYWRNCCQMHLLQFKALAKKQGTYGCENLPVERSSSRRGHLRTDLLDH